MNTTNPTATAWLRQLDELSGRLPSPQRDELQAELRDHLDRALGEDPSPETVRATFARMGDPADVVAAAMEEAAATGRRGRAARASALHLRGRGGDRPGPLRRRRPRRQPRPVAKACRLPRS